MNPDNVARFAQLAWQYGPFFFSVLFVIFVSSWTRKSYREVCARTNPPASHDEKAAHRWTFIGSGIVGTLLVLISVAWWLTHPTGIYVFRGVIQNLKSYEALDTGAADVYFRSVLRPVFPGDETPLRDERFIALQFTGPFKRGQTIPLDFSKGEAKRVTFQLDYNPDQPEMTYAIEWDEQAGKNVLKQLAPSKVSSLFPTVIHAARAESLPSGGAGVERAKGSAPRPAPTSQKLGYAQIIETLQDPLADVGSKIASVEHLSTLEDARFRECMMTSTSREPMLITLIDLSRHTDPELASKARRALARFDLDGYLVQQLKTSRREERQQAEEILFRLDKSRAEAVLGKLGTDDPAIKALREQIASGKKTKDLRPTGSAKGDQYYVRATWDPDRPAVVSCLTKLFNQELINHRTLEEEAALMKGRRDRVVYWYGKEWAISIARKIEDCGGQARFVSPRA